MASSSVGCRALDVLHRVYRHCGLLLFQFETEFAQHGEDRGEVTRHVRRSEFGVQLTSDQRLVGRIEWDAKSDGRLPLVVIDGQAFTWEQVGHMLMTFEGFTLEARVKDIIEIVGDVPSV